MNVSNAHITPYKTTPSSCLVQWDNYILLNPTYQAPSSRSLRAGSSDTLPRKYSVSISWQKPSNLRLQELLFKSEVAYFNDDSKTEQRKVKSSRLGKFQFSQRQYCLLSPQQNLQRVPALASLSEYIHTSSRGIDSINQTATTYHSVKHWLSHRTRDNRFQSLTLLSTSMPFHSLSLMVTHSL